MAFSPEPPRDAPAAPSQWALDHVQELGLFQEPAGSGRTEVVLITDPWSVWCWGFEPVRRALRHRYPSIAFRHHVGGMFERLPNPEEVGFNVERFFSVVQRSTGMPLRVDATRNERPESTYPACVHVHAVRLLRPDLEGAYLRRLREAIYLDARNVSNPEVAQAIAVDLGIPAVDFLEALASGEPDREFQSNLLRLHAANLHAYPTYLVRSGKRMARMEGFQTLPAILTAVEQVSRRVHPSLPAPEVLDVLVPGERVATREVAEVLDASMERVLEQLAALEQEGRVARERHAQGDVWMRAG